MTTRFALLIRFTFAFLLAIVVFGALAPGDSAVEAKSKRIAVFGTALSPVEDNEVVVATRHGVITLTITDSTKLDRKRGLIPLDEVRGGDYVVGYYSVEDDLLIAGKISIKRKNGKRLHDHIVGVVVQKDGDNITVQTGDGDEVEIEAPESEGDDSTEEGSLVVTVVETDPETGDVDAIGLRTAEETIARLNNAIESEITLAQEQILKIRMSETASVHLTRLYDTIGEIQAEAQAKIEAAFAEFQANYKMTLDDNLVDPPLVTIGGRLLSRTPDLLVIAKGGNGARAYVLVENDVEVNLVDGSSGTILDVYPDDFVEVQALPQTEISSPIARVVTVVPSPTDPDVGDTENDGPTDETITGVIVIVDDDGTDTTQVIVVDNPDGTEDAAAITPDTTITGDDELEAGQEVEVTLGDDGFEADEVVVVSDPDEPPVTNATPTVAPVISSPIYQLSGIIRSIANGDVVLDDVTLTFETAGSGDALQAGQEVEFSVMIESDGRPVITNISPK